MRWVFGIALVCVATVAVAHEGVKNPSVMARMHSMKTIGAESKVLGQMAKGAVSFDAARAQAAAGVLAQEAARIEALFEAQEDDPKAEALPAVWENFPDFAAKAQGLVDAAEAAKSVSSVEELQSAMQGIGATCGGCHKVYRKP